MPSSTRVTQAGSRRATPPPPPGTGGRRPRGKGPPASTAWGSRCRFRAPPPESSGPRVPPPPARRWSASLPAPESSRHHLPGGVHLANPGAALLLGDVRFVLLAEVAQR